MEIKHIYIELTINGVAIRKLVAPNNPIGYNEKDISSAYKWQSIFAKEPDFDNVKVVVE